MHTISSRFLVVAALAVAFGTSAVSAPRPAQAAITTGNAILIGAAAIAGIVLYNNWQHKATQANTVIGRTRNGGYVYADGRIVSGGHTYYSSNDGRTPCSYMARGGSVCNGSQSRGYNLGSNGQRPQWDSTQRNWRSNNGNPNSKMNRDHSH
jgi:hypothetical protein